MKIRTKHPKWTYEELQLEALKYNRRWDFQKGSPGAYHAAYVMKILDQICSHMKVSFINWTEKLITVEALKYGNIKAFQKGCQSAYHAAVRLGILDKVCSHMERLHIEWTFKMIKDEALKYRSRWEFQKNSNAYYAAKNMGILDLVCSHMRTPNISFQEKTILEEVLKFFPDAKKYRITKLNIPGKEFIRWFEADIFVPDLMKGVEFDGAYYHSFEYMRAGPFKAQWSDDDIRNYHEIKDAAFLSRGIQILHIKEEDWNRDQAGCIQRCLEFLGVSSEYKAA